MAMDPNFVAERLEREPLRLPIGVRATPTMQTSAMQQRSLNGQNFSIINEVEALNCKT
jgi:hypothetical protein